MSDDVDLLVISELNPDVLMTDATLQVRFGQVERLVDDADITLGGSGAITAAAAARQGLRVAICALVGDDLAGDIARRRLSELGVDTSPVIIWAGARTGLTVVLSRADGDRALLTFPGTMPQLRCSDVPAELLAAARHVHISSFYLQTGLHYGLEAMLMRARDRGVTISLDPGWDPAERWSTLVPILPQVDYLLPNAAECRHLAAAVGGTSPTSEVETAAAELARHGPAVIVKLGAAGALAAGQAGQLLRCPAAPVPILDTTGAGDNFDAGFLAGLLAGAPMREALARAVASGSWSLAGRGGTGRLATAAEACHGAAGLLAHAGDGTAAGSTHHLIPAEEPA